MPSLLALLILLFPLAAAAADTPVIVWGFSSDCKPMPEVDRAVRKHLEESAYPAVLLEGAESHLGCQPEQCAAILRSSCAKVSGLLLGGTVYRGKFLRTRLWLYDLDHNRVAYQDDYSQQSDVESTLGTHAGALLDRPSWDTVPTATPMYCLGDGGRAAAPTPGNVSRVYYVAYGARGPRTALANVLRQAVQDGGREALPVPSRQEADTYTLSVLRRITGKSEGAQVLGAEIVSEQKVQLWLFDSTTGQTAGQPLPLECAGCDRETLAQKVKAEATALLGSCFGESCTKKLDVLRAPKEACEPMAVPQCGGSSQAGDVASPSARGDAGQAEISPRMARLTKGGLWGTFGVLAGASAALLIANYAGAGRTDVGPGDITNSLIPASGALAGGALVSLAFAIPLTIAIDRATSKSAASQRGTTREIARKSSGLHCPN